jgi:hypothetical protein
MEFTNDLHRQTYEHVQGLLSTLYGGQYAVSEEWPRFILQEGSAELNVLVLPWGDDRAVVELRAYVVFGAELTAELMRYLLQKNDEMVLGAFGVDGDGDVFFSHTLLADDLGTPELRTSVAAVMSAADEYDDEIQKRWGGQRVADRWEQAEEPD